MSLKKNVLGIVSSFLVVGTVATSTYEASYQKLYEEQEKQEVQIKKAMDSEFITSSDKEKLDGQLIAFDQAKSSEVKAKLSERIKNNQDSLKIINQLINQREATTAASEIEKLHEQLKDLSLKGDEPFVLKSDKLLVSDLKKELQAIDASIKVKPIRELSRDVDELSIQLINNQAQTKSDVEELKKYNKKLDDLSKHEYFLESDKKAISELQKENETHFKDVDEMSILETQHKESEQLFVAISEKIKVTENDFIEHGPKVKELISLSSKLLSEGQLDDSERTQLENYNHKIKEIMEKKGYTPGDLKNHYDKIQPDYQTILENSQKRIAEAERKAAEEAKKQQEEARRQEQQAASQSTVVGGWHQAPAGKKYLKVESGKTYGQVKNPGNFSLITIEEAANYSPGHGNGSAKQ